MRMENSHIKMILAMIAERNNVISIVPPPAPPAEKPRAEYPAIIEYFGLPKEKTKSVDREV